MIFKIVSSIGGGAVPVATHDIKLQFIFVHPKQMTKDGHMYTNQHRLSNTHWIKTTQINNPCKRTSVYVADSDFSPSLYSNVNRMYWP